MIAAQPAICRALAWAAAWVASAWVEQRGAAPHPDAPAPVFDLPTDAPTARLAVSTRRAVHSAAQRRAAAQRVAVPPRPGRAAAPRGPGAPEFGHAPPAAAILQSGRDNARAGRSLQGKSRGRSGQHPKRGPVPRLDLYLDPSSRRPRIRIEFDRIRPRRRRIRRDVDKPGGAPDSPWLRWGGQGHVTGLGDRVGDERDRALHELEVGDVLVTALFVDEIVHRNTRIGGQARTSSHRRR